MEQALVAQGIVWTITITAADCTQSAGTQNYSCSVDYTAVCQRGCQTADPAPMKWRAGFPATCDDAGKCSWSASTSNIQVG